MFFFPIFFLPLFIIVIVVTPVASVVIISVIATVSVVSTGVSSFFSSTAWGRRRGGGTTRVSDREGFDAVAWKWYLGARLGRATRDAPVGGRRRSAPRSVRENAEGNRPPAGFFFRGGRRRGRHGRRTGGLERNWGRTGVSAGAESLMVLLRSSGACERVSLGVLAGADLAEQQPALFDLFVDRPCVRSAMRVCQRQKC